MNEMRKLINLMEGVTAVPGLNETWQDEFADMAQGILAKHNASRPAAPAHVPAPKRSREELEAELGSLKSQFDPQHQYSDDYSFVMKQERIQDRIRSLEAELSTQMEQLNPGGAGGEEANMQTAGTVGRNNSYAAFDAAQGQATEESVSSGEWRNYTVTTTTGKHVVYGPPDKDEMQSHLAGQYGGSGKRMYGEVIDMVPYNGPVDTGRDEKSGRSYWDEAVDESVPAVKSCQQSNPADADIACAMEENMSDNDFNFIRGAISQMYQFSTSEEELKRMVAGETGYGQNPDFDELFTAALNDYLGDFDDDTSYDDSMDGDHDSAMASAGHGSDEDYGDFPIDEATPPPTIDPAEVNALAKMAPDAARSKALDIVMNSNTNDRKKEYLTRNISAARNTMEIIKLLFNMILAGEGNAVQGSNQRYNNKFKEGLEEAYDMNNGYKDVHNADGQDYFPDGADGPVVDNVGPSGARHGDNPEQKKMQIAEVHKELVYGYRSFLKESSKKTSK
jgi:hypothetical protein